MPNVRIVDADRWYDTALAIDTTQGAFGLPAAGIIDGAGREMVALSVVSDRQRAGKDGHPYRVITVAFGGVKPTQSRPLTDLPTWH